MIINNFLFALSIGCFVAVVVLALLLAEAHNERDDVKLTLADSLALTDRAIEEIKEGLGGMEQALALCTESASEAKQPNREQAKNGT